MISLGVASRVREPESSALWAPEWNRWEGQPPMAHASPTHHLLRLFKSQAIFGLSISRGQHSALCFARRVSFLLPFPRGKDDAQGEDMDCLLCTTFGTSQGCVIS